MLIITFYPISYLFHSLYIEIHSTTNVCIYQMSDCACIRTLCMYITKIWQNMYNKQKLTYVLSSKCIRLAKHIYVFPKSRYTCQILIQIRSSLLYNVQWIVNIQNPPSSSIYIEHNAFRGPTKLYFILIYP